MPDAEHAVVDQPQPVADATQRNNADFLGAPADDSLPADPSPETQSAVAEPEAGVAEGEVAEATQSDETEQTSDEDAFLAQLTPEEQAYYAKRYPTLWKAAQDPNQPADLRQAFVDRVNQDHAWAERKAAEDEGEPTAEDQGADATEATTDPAKQRTEYYNQIEHIVSTQLDPQSVEEMGKQMLDAMGVDLKSEDPEIQAIVKNAPKLGKVLARGAVDLLATTLPNLLSSRLEMVMPGITKMYYRTMYNEVWDQVKDTAVKAADGTVAKPYTKLPAFGSQQFRAAIDKISQEVPGFADMYQNLPPQQQAARQYALMAKLMTQSGVTPAAVAEAVDTGKRIARQAVVTRKAGQALGAGRSASQLGNQSQDDDPVMRDLDAAIARANADLSPLSKR